MKQLAQGKIHEQIIAVPDPSYPAYVIRGSRKSMMIDAGVNLLGPRYLSSLGDIFGDPRHLDYLFLTHSHYDHLGSAYYLKMHIPGLTIGAHERVAPLLQKKSVLEMMNQLSGNHAATEQGSAAAEDLALRPFAIDLRLKQGDEFDLGGLTCRVYATPGHTRDSLAFYIPQIKALFAGEAAGVMQAEAGAELQVEFLSSYADYIDSLKLLIALKPEIVGLAHGFVLTGEDATDFLERSLAETFRYRALIERHLAAAGGDVERAVEDLAHSQYDLKGGIFQELNAYMTNLNAQVKHIAELRGDRTSPGGLT